MALGTFLKWNGMDFNLLNDNIMISKIENIICIGEGLSPEEIHNKCRNGELKETRQMIMYFAHKMTRKTWKEIGGYFDLDHATAIHACKTIKNLIDTDREFKGKMLVHENRLTVIELDRSVKYVNNTFKTLEFESMKLEKKVSDLLIRIKEIKERIGEVSTPNITEIKSVTS